MTTNRHAYICECPGPCRERIYLRPARYRELARYGTLVSPYCAAGRVVLLAEPGVRVVASTLNEERSP